MESALEDLVTVGQVSVLNRTSTGDGTTFSWIVRFDSGNFDDWNVPALQINTDLLTGSGASATVYGGDNAVQDFAVHSAEVVCASCVMGETPIGYAYQIVPSSYSSSVITALDAG